MANQLAEGDNHSIQYVSAKGDRIGGRGLQLPLFQICKLGGLTSQSIKLGTQTCIQYHSYGYINHNCKLTSTVIRWLHSYHAMVY